MSVIGCAALGRAAALARRRLEEEWKGNCNPLALSLSKGADYRLIESEAFFVTPPNEAVIVAEVFPPVVVVTVKVAEPAPAPTVTEGGTAARLDLLLDRVTTRPPAGALPLKATVPVEFDPPTTVVGLSESEDNTGGRTVSGADLPAPL